MDTIGSQMEEESATKSSMERCLHLFITIVFEIVSSHCDDDFEDG